MKNLSILVIFCTLLCVSCQKVERNYSLGLDSPKEELVLNKTESHNTFGFSLLFEASDGKMKKISISVSFSEKNYQKLTNGAENPLPAESVHYFFGECETLKWKDLKNRNNTTFAFGSHYVSKYFVKQEVIGISGFRVFHELSGENFIENLKPKARAAATGYSLELTPGKDNYSLEYQFPKINIVSDKINPIESLFGDAQDLVFEYTKNRRDHNLVKEQFYALLRKVENTF